MAQAGGDGFLCAPWGYRPRRPRATLAESSKVNGQRPSFYVLIGLVVRMPLLRASYPLRGLSYEATKLLRLNRKKLHLGLHIAVLNC